MFQSSRWRNWWRRRRAGVMGGSSRSMENIRKGRQRRAAGTITLDDDGRRHCIQHVGIATFAGAGGAGGQSGERFLRAVAFVDHQHRQPAALTQGFGERAGGLCGSVGRRRPRSSDRRRSGHRAATRATAGRRCAQSGAGACTSTTATALALPVSALPTATRSGACRRRSQHGAIGADQVTITPSFMRGRCGWRG